YEGGELRGHPAGGYQATLSPLQSCDLLLGNRGGGIAIARVQVGIRAPFSVPAHLLNVRQDTDRGLRDRGGQGTFVPVTFFPGMNAAGGIVIGLHAPILTMECPVINMNHKALKKAGRKSSSHNSAISIQPIRRTWKS